MRRKRLLIIFSVFGILLLFLHLLFSFRSREVLNALLEKFSGGTYAVKTANVDITYFPLSIEIDTLEFYPLKSGTKIEKITCDHLVLKIEKPWALVMNRYIDLKEFCATHPEVVINESDDSQKKKRQTVASFGDLRKQLFRLFDLLKAEKIRLSDAAIKINKDKVSNTFFSLNKIFLSIDDFHLEHQDGGLKNPFHGEASFSLLHPEIHLADTNLSVTIDELALDKSSGILKIDSLSISKHDDELQDEGIRLASVAIKHFNWSGFIEQGIIEIDSATILRGDATINLANQIKKESSNAEKKNTYSGGLMLLHHVAVNDISYSMLIRDYMKKGDGKVNFKITGDRLELHELRLDPDKNPFASVKEIDVRLKNYFESDSQDKYSVSLGSIKFTDGNLALKDYLLQPSKNSSMSSNNKVSVADLIVNQLSLKELLQKKAVAEKIVIGQPEVIIDLNKTNTEHKPQNNLNRSIQNALESWKDRVAIDQLVLTDGKLRLQTTNNSGDDFVISGVALKLNGKKAVASRSLPELLQSINEFKSSGIKINGPKTDLTIGKMRWLKDKTGLRLEDVHGRMGDNTKIDFDEVELLLNNKRTLLENRLIASLIKINGGNVSIIIPEKEGKKKTLPLFVSSDRVILDNLHLKLATNAGASYTTTMGMELNDFNLGGTKRLYESIRISAFNNLLLAGKTTIEAREIIAVQPGVFTFNQIKGSNANEKQRMDFNAESLTLALKINTEHPEKSLIDSVFLNAPALSYTIYSKQKLKKDTLASPAVPNNNIGFIQLTNPKFSINVVDSSGESTIITNSVNGIIQLNDIRMEEKLKKNCLTVARLKYETDQLSAKVAKQLFEPATVRVLASNLCYNFSDQSVNGLIDQLTLNGFHHRFVLKNKDTLTINGATLNFYNYPLTKNLNLEWKELLSSYRWSIADGQLNLKSENSQLSVHGLFAEHDKHFRFGFDSLMFGNKGDREAYWKSQPFEKDFMNIMALQCEGKNTTLSWEKNVPVLHIPKLDIGQLSVHPERDKSRPEDTVSYRPLLAKQFQSFPFPMIIDTVNIAKGNLVYREIGKKTMKEGVISFSNLNGYIYNLRNHEINENDSLIIRLSASLYDAGSLRLNFRQSYTDSLQGFRMRIRLKDFEMAKFNALLSPLMRLQLSAGKIDTLTIMVNGNDAFSFGTINMNYEGLSVKYLGKNEDEQFFMNGPLNWLVNQFIRSSDEGKTNLLFRRRNRKRGQFNFWGKIAMQGLLSDIGLKRDDAERKAFEKTVRKMDLPANYWLEE